MGDIYFATVDYGRQVYPVYAAILNNPVGEVIVGEIKATTKALTFISRTQRNIDAWGVCNADTSGLDKQAGAPSGVSGQGLLKWYKGNVDNPLTPDDDERYDLAPTGYKGTGEGSDVTIAFDPDSFVKARCDAGGPVSKPDEVLLHEMVHALRYMQGRANPYPTEDSGYDSDEEYLAIVVANVYVSAKGPTLPLRADHHGHNKLDDKLSTSAGFLADPRNLKLLSIYRLLWTSTFMKLASLPTPTFNPFRELQARLRYYGKVS